MAEDVQQHPLHPVVVGALKDTINQHGPISSLWIGSAAKRIVAAVLAAQKEEEKANV
jgi:hypothetical protein